jgi:transcriptional regulator NrdR family protein
MSKDKITQEDIDRYVKFGGEYCPFCKSTEVVQDGVMFYDEDESKVYKGMMCLTCDREWTDVFTLSTIKTVVPVIISKQSNLRDIEDEKEVA